MKAKICQSCGMPMQQPEDFGTQADGTQNPEFCTFCYQHGAFTQAFDMEQMIDHCLQFLGEFNQIVGTEFSPEEARAEMLQFFPTLKRWSSSD
jgi:hypothetical protein